MPALAPFPMLAIDPPEDPGLDLPEVPIDARPLPVITGACLGCGRILKWRRDPPACPDCRTGVVRAGVVMPLGRVAVTDAAHRHFLDSGRSLTALLLDHARGDFGPRDCSDCGLNRFVIARGYGIVQADRDVAGRTVVITSVLTGKRFPAAWTRVALADGPITPTPEEPPMNTATNGHAVIPVNRLPIPAPLKMTAMTDADRVALLRLAAGMPGENAGRVADAYHAEGGRRFDPRSVAKLLRDVGKGVHDAPIPPAPPRPAPADDIHGADAEFAALGTIWSALRGLDDAARTRVLSYIGDRLKASA